MGIAEILALMTGAMRVFKAGADIVERLNREGGEPTGEEIAILMVDQAAAENNWEAQLARLRAQAEGTTETTADPPPTE